MLALMCILVPFLFTWQLSDYQLTLALSDRWRSFKAHLKANTPFVDRDHKPPMMLDEEMRRMYKNERTAMVFSYFERLVPYAIELPDEVLEAMKASRKA
jgi:hypothetical protein